MTLWLAILLAAVTLKDAGPLRNGCSPDAEIVAQLAAGSAVEVRFALSGEAVPCYKVSAETGGKRVDGYLPASALQGLEDFDKARRDAAWLDATQVLGAIKASAPTQAMATGGFPAVKQAAELIQTSQPGRALELLEPELKKRKDPNLLALAGVAAWRNDDAQRALDLWRASIELQPNPDLERLMKRVEKETQGDKSADRLIGLRVMLRYEGQTVPPEIARTMVAVLDEEFTRISSQLGCNAQERVVAIVQSRDAFRKSTDAAEWSGGQFDGRIRIPLLESATVGPETRRVLAHEMVHACLSMIGRYPAWLHEGLAQKYSGERPDRRGRERLSEMARAGTLPRLANLRQDWSRLSSQHAWAAYQLSLMAIDLFFQHYGEWGVRNLLSNPERLPEITADLDKRLGL